MAQLSEPMFRDEAIPEEIAPYKPYSPAAMVGLVVGVGAILAALSVWNLGWGFLPLPIVGLLLGLKGAGSVRRYDMAGGLAAKLAVLFSTLSLLGGSGGYLYILKTAVPPDYEQISYDPLQGGFGGMIPPEVQKLEGKKVYLKGYMYPTNYDKSRFVLCRDNGTCCFGGQPKLNDMVEIKVKPGLSIDYTSSLHGIGGTFHTRSEDDPNGLGQIIYHIDDADVLH